MPDHADKLVKLAEQKFPKLLPFTAAEEKMLRAAADGEYAHCDFGGDTDPAKADKWDEKRTIRAELLRWLCIDAKAKKLIDPKGIQVAAVRIEGKIDLAYTNIPFPLILAFCALPEGIDLRQAETRSLYFNKSHISPASEGNEDNVVPIDADGLTVKGGLSLRNAVVRGEVRLARAKITADLDCKGGRFENKNGFTLSADGAEIGGNVFLNNGFGATGEVRLLGAKITGDLQCRGGHFENKNEKRPIALNVDGAEIGGGVFLDKGDEKDATPFFARGGVRLTCAKIMGDLACRGGQFENKNSKEPKALSVERAEIGSGLFLDGGFRIAGQLNLLHARAAALHDNKDKKCWPETENLLIDGFEYGAIGSLGPTDARTRKEWLERQYPKDAKREDNLFCPQPYEQLAKVLRQAGHEEEAKKILMAKEDDRYKYSKMGFFARRWNRVLKYTIGNGYRVRRVLAWALLVVLIGTLLFAWAGAKGGMVPAKERVYMESESYKSTRTPPDEYPQFKCFWYSLDCFVPVVDLHQESYWEPMWENSAGCVARGYLWCHIAAGWILTTLGVVGITGLVRKELPKK